MASKSQAIWVMRSGSGEKAHSEFVIEDYVSLGWSKCGDLRLVPPDRKAFRKQYRSHYPDDTLAAARMRASELYRFLHKMKVGDSVIYPSRRHDLVYVGHVAGDYQYKSKNQTHRHVRKIKWLRKVKWSRLPSKVIGALSGRPALYQAREYASDVRKTLLQ